MIIDKITNHHRYHSLSGNLQKALTYITETDFTALEPGKYIIDGDNIYAMVQRYQTQPMEVKGYWEAHQNYLDIQLVVAGSELFGYAPLETTTIKTPYNPDKDKTVHNAPDGEFFTLRKGHFAILYPEDVHWPARQIGSSSQEVLKVVVKVKI